MLTSVLSKSASAARPPPQVQVDLDDLISLRFNIRSIALPGGLPARTVLTGGHQSRTRGRGMDYLESRHYQPGDDIRTMDWRVTARAGHPHTKVYEQERERPVMVLVDFGPSMFFGTRGSFKSVAAARAAALVGWGAIAGGDRIGGLLFNGGHRELAPRGGRRGVMALLRALGEEGVTAFAHLSGSDPSGGLTPPAAAYSSMNEALLRLQRVVHPGSLVYLISDFFGIDGSDGACARQLSLLRRHSQLIALQVVDPLELAPPPPGEYGVGDGRNSGIIDTRSAGTREAWQHYLARHHATVRELFAGQQTRHVVVSTAEDVAGQLDAAARNKQDSQERLP